MIVTESQTVPPVVGQPYVRVCVAENGDSIFVDEEFALTTVQMWEGRVDGKSEPLGDVEVTLRRVFEDSSTGYLHPAPARQFIVVLADMVEVEVSDGTKRRFGAGSIILMDDAGGNGHISRWVGDAEPLALVLRFAQQ
ncbi:hypothetical protein [Salipiger abyssi]|uniref:hypothetical protein n=1 Tax=Salipiger abyssi TaxID=1250539 RepID=UPI0040589857